MTAPSPVLAFESTDADLPSAREWQMRRTVWDASSELAKVRPADDTIGDAVSDLNRATEKYVNFIGRRNQRLERALRRALDSDGLDAELRADVVAILCGTKGIGRDPKLYRPHEVAMIERYRKMPIKRRAAMSTMIEALATAPESDE
jgi:hypothetical protein